MLDKNYVNILMRQFEKEKKDGERAKAGQEAAKEVNRA